MSPRVWFITGSANGFGRFLTEHVLSQGEVVVATARRTSPLDDLKTKYPSDRLMVVKVDVSNSREIADAFAQVKAAFGRLDVVVNNAGWGVFGEVEAVREEDARAMFDTNFWGAVNVSREAVKFFREVNAPGVGGRLLQISSLLGVGGGPGVGFYSATKFALEGVSESLAAELDPAWNIKVTIIEPGGYRTDGLSKVQWATAHPAYANPELPATKMRGFWDKISPSGDPRKAAKSFYEIASLPDPPLHLPLGKDAIAKVRGKIASLSSDTNKYEYLSQDLELDQ
ncbi:NAD-P-binding protein [Cubamyces lactineus]|nr:NAD-P-binding protein [Cubamyces lactineus]